MAKERKVMEEEFDASSDVIFNYGYGCCAFAHNICGSDPMIPSRMPDTTKPLSPEFFINPRCPPSASSDPPSIAAIRGKPLTKSPSSASDGINVSPELPAGADEGSHIAAEG